ncbi:hypothetical protein GCM10023199_58600 [Actinomycetospora chibensis]
MVVRPVPQIAVLPRLLGPTAQQVGIEPGDDAAHQSTQLGRRPVTGRAGPQLGVHGTGRPRIAQLGLLDHDPHVRHRDLSGLERVEGAGQLVDQGLGLVDADLPGARRHPGERGDLHRHGLGHQLRTSGPTDAALTGVEVLAGLAVEVAGRPVRDRLPAGETFSGVVALVVDEIDGLRSGQRRRELGTGNPGRPQRHGGRTWLLHHRRVAPVEHVFDDTSHTCATGQSHLIPSGVLEPGRSSRGMALQRLLSAGRRRAGPPFAHG